MKVNMFGIGFFEFLVIGLLVLIFVKPKDFPLFLRKVGIMYTNLRKTYDETMDYMNRIARMDADQTKSNTQARMDQDRTKNETQANRVESNQSHTAKYMIRKGSVEAAVVNNPNAPTVNPKKTVPNSKKSSHSKKAATHSKKSSHSKLSSSFKRAASSKKAASQNSYRTFASTKRKSKLGKLAQRPRSGAVRKRTK